MGRHSRGSGFALRYILPVLMGTLLLSVVFLAPTPVAPPPEQVPMLPVVISGTIPPGGSLPREGDCAARITRTLELIPENQEANSTNPYADGYRLAGSQLGHYGNEYESRVTGNFTGTTDQIIEWAACKWGFPPDTVRAQAVTESSWRQSMLGDCERGGRTQPETHNCQSIGLMQVKGADIPPTHPGTWPYAWTSTSFNVDYALGIRRACFEGKEIWLGNGYAAGDEWGCIGRWFSGDWHGSTAERYIEEVKRALVEKTWTTYGSAWIHR
jgi:hypothetical protein